MKKILTRTIPNDIPVLHEHPLLHRIYATRGINNARELDYSLKNLAPYDKLLGIEEAVECLVVALREQLPVLVLGDFDADGATSTALAVLALKAFGLQHVSYLIPSRFLYGYGLTPEIVTQAAEQKPYLILTVDNGINGIEGAQVAKQLGIKVLITDHHLPGAHLPEAVAIVNPNQPGDEFVSKSLAGVGVIFYLMLALRAKLRSNNWFIEKNIFEPNMAQYLDLVALGTIADAVVLDHNNRILVLQGLKRIRSGKCNLGIKALFEVAKRNLQKATVHDLGFMVAPRLNAAGRLDDMSLGIEGLITDDLKQARSVAQKLDMLNKERRSIEDEMQRQAIHIINTLKEEHQSLPTGLCVFEESWHQGVLGILAGRLKDKLQRPVIVFTAVSNGQIKGSARSVSGVHLYDVLTNIAVNYPNLMTKFGGHAMAAGVTLERNNYKFFSSVFAAEIKKHLASEELRGIIYTDGELPVEHFGLNFAELLADAGPWGSGFVEPTFHGEFGFAEQVLISRRHLKLRLRHLTSGQELAAICFNVNPEIWPNQRLKKIKIVYKLHVNEYNRRRSLQLMINEVMGYE